MKTQRGGRGDFRGVRGIQGRVCRPQCSSPHLRRLSLELLEQRRMLSTDLALWVWSDEVTNAEARETLVNRSAASGVDHLYQSVYRSSPNSDGWRMYAASDIAALITLAHGEGIEVWAAYGAPDWASGGHDFALDRVREVNAYNDRYHTTKFDGVTLDVEPETSELPGLLTLYQDVRDTLNSDIKLAAAIRFWWDMAVVFPPGSGNAKPAYEHIIDMDLDKVVVMGYRDSAAGIISLDEDEIAYADSLGKEDLIVAGVETSNCAPGCGPEFVTFFEEGQVALNTESDKVGEHFAESTSFGGFAIQAYGTAYLSGNDPGWPAYNIRSYIFYNNSVFDGNDAMPNAQDDNAIAPDKQPLMPGQAASFVNYTSYGKKHALRTTYLAY